MPAAYPKALCEKVILKYYGLQQPYAKVAEDLLVSANFCRAVMRRWLNNEQIWAAGKAGTKTRFRAFSPAVLGVPRTLMTRRETAYLDELQAMLFRATGLQVSLPGLCRALREIGFTRKQVMDASSCAS